VTHLEKGILKNCAASLAGQRAGFFAGRLPVHVPVVRALSRECHKHGGAKTMTTSSFVSSFISPGDHDGSSAVACFDRLLFPAFPVSAPVNHPCSSLLFLAAFPGFARLFSSLVEFFACSCRDLQARSRLDMIASTAANHCKTVSMVRYSSMQRLSNVSVKTAAQRA